MKQHPQRLSLTNEVHARPYAKLTSPVRATHLALLTGEDGGPGDRAHLARLCERFGMPPPAELENHLMLDFGDFTLKWERHTEFSTYTFYRGGSQADGQAFTESVTALLPQDWLDALPGELLVGLQVEVLGPDAPEPRYEDLLTIFGDDNYCGSNVTGGAAAAWMDFTLHADGYGRVLVKDRHLRPRQAGRLVQRLLEIETYRMMALLALPLARELGPELTDVGRRLYRNTQQLPEIAALEDERDLLADLTRLSGEIEKIASATGYRFSAARAYYALVRRRIEELREERVEGLQTFGEFMDRRLAPAMRTCEAMAERIDRLSRRLARAGQLLRARVEIEQEAQNQNLLHSMDRRAKLQLRLQETVEGLSVAAITYYVVGLVAYAAKALKEAGLPLDTDIAPGLAIPVVAGLAWYGVRRIRRMVSKQGQN